MKLGTLFKQKKSLLCLIGTITGTIITAGLVINATAQATKVIDEEWSKLPIRKQEKMKDFTLPEKFKMTWKLYLPAMISEGLTITSAILGYRLHENQLKAVTALYSAAEASLVAHQHKIMEEFGEEKAREIGTAVANEMGNRNPETELNRATEIISDKIRFYDALSGRYFYASVDDIKSAMIDLNAMMNEGPCTVNDLYSCMDLPGVDMGNDIGWSKKHLHDRLEWGQYACLDNNDQPYTYIMPTRRPQPLGTL